MGGTETGRPRLNAIGRLGHARLAVELFTRADATRAREIAATLDAHNRQRQEVERQIVRQAEAMVVARGFDRRRSIRPPQRPPNA